MSQVAVSAGWCKVLECSKTISYTTVGTSEVTLLQDEFGGTFFCVLLCLKVEVWGSYLGPCSLDGRGPKQDNNDLELWEASPRQSHV